MYTIFRIQKFNIYNFLHQCRNYEYMPTLEIRGTSKRTKYRLCCKNSPT